MNNPRVALFACSHDEVDGVANTVRHYANYAESRQFPLLVVHGGYNSMDTSSGTVRTVKYKRKFPKFTVDKKHEFDLWFWRHLDKAEKLVKEFEPGIIHITGPSDVGMLGALIAHRQKIPLAASWHTNLHEYAERRAAPILRPLPPKVKRAAGIRIKSASMALLARFYKIPQILFAPNRELMELLNNATGKECHLMARGVDVDLFNPERRSRQEGLFTIGYVGRITVEKSVDMLVSLEKELINAGFTNFCFCIVGQGAMEAELKRRLMKAEFPGVLYGERLAESYANMDAFVFPSKTDTFGNVVLEAMASGVPALVSNSGGPKFIVRHEETGFIASGARDFAFYIVDLMCNPEKRRLIGQAARAYAAQQSWDSVFDSVFQQYRQLQAAPIAAFDAIPLLRPDVFKSQL
jgi:phosphatidylinositol alpha 1,6-mannosyltransferase